MTSKEWCVFLTIKDKATGNLKRIKHEVFGSNKQDAIKSAKSRYNNLGTICQTSIIPKSRGLTCC